MAYFIREVVYTIQGEGANAGRPAVLCRFSPSLFAPPDQQRTVASVAAGNLASAGDSETQQYSSAGDLAAAVARTWPSSALSKTSPAVVCTGARLLDQLDVPLIAAFHASGFHISIEVDGTRQPPQGIDWITVKPQAGRELVVHQGSELKVEYPQPGLDPTCFEELCFPFFFIQPKNDHQWEQNVREAIDYCLRHPRWRLALQIHKVLGLP